MPISLNFDMRGSQQAKERLAAYKPLLGLFGADVAARIGPALTSSDPGAQQMGQGMLADLLAQRQRLQQSKLPVEQQVARLPPIDRAKFESEQALGRQRLLAGDQTIQEMEQAARLGPLNEQAARALIASREASRQASLANAALAQSGRITQVQGTLNQRFLAQMQAPVEVADAVQQAEQALKTGDSLGVLAASVKLAKILDPTSVVREGEVTTVQGGIGLAAQLVNGYNKLFGQGMTPAGMQAYQQLIRAVAGPVLQRGVRIEDEVRKAAAVMEADPDMAATGIGWPSNYVRRYLQGMPDPNTNADHEL